MESQRIPNQFEPDSIQGQAITGLQAKLTSLEQTYQMQATRHEQLSREVNQLRQLAPTTAPPQQQQQQKQQQQQQQQLQHQQQQQLQQLQQQQQQLQQQLQQQHQQLRHTSCGDQQMTSHDGTSSIGQSLLGRNVNSPRASPSPIHKQQCQNNFLSVRADDSIQTPPFQVFYAKYSYNPIQFSPNENPEAELLLKAGDYIFIYGLVDDDGFYDGELMDGRRGLVPSNFIEKVPEEELEEFYVSHGSQETLLKTVESKPQLTRTDRTIHRQIPDQPCLVVVSEDITEEDMKDMKDYRLAMLDKYHPVVTEIEDPPHDVPFPRELRLEKRLLSSLLIAWTAPINIALTPILSYNVYMDGQLKVSVKASDRTKALLEKVDTTKIHCISVRSITSQGQSKDQQCSITIGSDVVVRVTDLLVGNVTATSATLSWLPFDSNLEHIVSVNGQSCSILKATIYRCLVTGLAPETKHTVSIRPKVTQGSAQAVSVTFRTLKLEIPDAPAEVQVETGPQQGTLLVTWHPVKPNGKPPNSLVTGYSIYVDGRRIKELSSPNGDHVVLSPQDFATISNPHQITIRSTTGMKESFDSTPVTLTKQLLAELQAIVQIFHTTSQSSSSDHPTSSTWPHHHQQSPRPQSDYGRSSTLTIAAAHHGGAAGGSVDSGFSAAQLSPLELRFSAAEIDALHNGYGAGLGQGAGGSKMSGATRNRSHSARSVRTVPGQDGLPVIEVTNGSLSDSSYDVDSEENFDRRRNLSGPPGLGGSGGGPGGGGVHSSHHNGGRHHGTSRSSRDHYDRAQGEGSRRHGRSSRVDALRGGRAGGGDRNGGWGAGGGRGKVMYAMTICDYDPATMSPNPDGIDEELPFKEGQVVKIWGSKDADGFYMGESNGRRGLVPSNMITEIHDTNLINQFERGAPGADLRAGGGVGPQGMVGGVASGPTSGPGRAPGAGPGRSDDVTRREGNSNNRTAGPQPTQNSRHRQTGSTLSGPSRCMVANYSYEARQNPSLSGRDTELGELSFQAGDIVIMFGEPDNNGFYFAEREKDRKRGHVPSSYFRDVTGAGGPTSSSSSFSHPVPPQSGTQGGVQGQPYVGTQGTMNSAHQGPGPGANQTAPYGTNQTNQTTPYGSNQSAAYGNNQTNPTAPYGANQTTAYGTNQNTQYGNNQPGQYGSNQAAPYGTNQSVPYGTNQTGTNQAAPYGTNQTGTNQASSYGTNQTGSNLIGSYGTSQPSHYGSNQTGTNQTAPFGTNQPVPHGTNQTGLYGSNQTNPLTGTNLTAPYGTNQAGSFGTNQTSQYGTNQTGQFGVNQSTQPGSNQHGGIQGGQQGAPYGPHPPGSSGTGFGSGQGSTHGPIQSTPYASAQGVPYGVNQGGSRGPPFSGQPDPRSIAPHDPMGPGGGIDSKRQYQGGPGMTGSQATGSRGGSDLSRSGPRGPAQPIQNPAQGAQPWRPSGPAGGVGGISDPGAMYDPSGGGRGVGGMVGGAGDPAQRRLDRTGDPAADQRRRRP